MPTRPVIVLVSQRPAAVGKPRAVCRRRDRSAGRVLLYSGRRRSGHWVPGAASRWWLDKSLAKLDAALKAIGGELTLRRGSARSELPKLASEVNAAAVFFSRAYEPWACALEQDLKSALDQCGVAFKRYAGALLREPEDIRTKTGRSV